MEVYADILFLTNFFMDAAMLSIVAFLVKRPVRAYRILLGAFVLSVYAVFMFLPKLHILYTIVGQALILAFANFLVFGRERFIKNTLLFWFVSASCGGIVFAISGLGDFGKAVKTSVSNGVIYMELNPLLLLFSIGILTALICVYRNMCIKRFTRDNLLIETYISYKDKEYKFKTLVDTGCEIRNPITDAPSVVLSKNVIKNIDKEICVSANTVTGKGELYIIFPDFLKGENQDWQIDKKVSVMVTEVNLSDDGFYDAVINPEGLLEKENIKLKAVALK